ncbi:nucleotidyltransferase family protein [Halovivax gelatinilyticus]|uniref:nucleotidyltransferase family protein n=1 Tax=Halovivax gelatinilyticus TaxID=2961597 RepID=UPI0020CA3CA9|nr:nucleotidyltransferase family protein [Halovivax gelatinilyticus]
MVESAVHAVVPAAGRGTRLAPLTDDRPKPLVEIAGRPLLARVFDALSSVDLASYVVVIGYRGEQIRDRFGDAYDGTPIECVTQSDPIGLADAVRRAGRVVSGDPFVVCNGDNVLNDDLSRLVTPSLLDPSAPTESSVLVERTTRRRAGETGVVVTTDSGRIERMVEKPDEPPSTLVSAGAYAFSPSIVEACEAIDPAPTGEYELADAISYLVERDRSVEAVPLRRQRVNVNDVEDLDQAEERVDQ